MIRLPSFKRGDKIRAVDMQAMADAIKELRESFENVRGGAGVEIVNSAAGLVIALAGGGKSRWELAKIVGAPPWGAPVLPSDCAYTIRGLDSKFEMSDVIPEYGRPCFGDDHHIYPDKVGHLCLVLRNPQDGGVKIAEMWVFGEKPYTGPC